MGGRAGVRVPRLVRVPPNHQILFANKPFEAPPPLVLDELLDATARRISDSASVAFPQAVSLREDPPEEPLSGARTALSGCRSKGQSRSVLMESDGPGDAAPEARAGLF